MRRFPLLVVAAASSLLTAAAVAIPALADRGEESTGDFDDCLRKHGFDVRPENGRVELRITPEGVWLNGEQVDADAFREARRECRPPRLFPAEPGMLPALPFDLEVVPPELRERMERFRDCLDLELTPEEDV